MKHSANSSQSSPASAYVFGDNFIPDLCARQNALALIISTQILALIVAIVRTEVGIIEWTLLGSVSVLMHLIAMTSAAIICSLRKTLSDFKINTQSACCVCVVLITTAMYSSLSMEFLPIPGHLPDLDFIVRNCVIALLVCSLIVRYLYIAHLAKRNEKAELESRIQALQSRIRPHFLFNSMNSIASLISSKPNTAEDAVLDLCELFRATLNTQSRYVQIHEELELCRKYLNIEGLRLGPRLSIDWGIDDEVNSYLIPPLTLQPLVENAVYHGIQPLSEGGSIEIRSYKRSDSIYILISNPFRETAAEHHGNQVALGNIAARMNALFSGTAVLKTSQNNGVFTATLRFPATKVMA